MTATALSMSMLAITTSAVDDGSVPACDCGTQMDVKYRYEGELDGNLAVPAYLFTSDATVRVTYVSDQEEYYGAIGVAGMSNDWEWVQSDDNPAYVSEGIYEPATNEMSVTDFIDFAGFTDFSNINTVYFMNWGLAEGEDVIIEIITPTKYYVEVPLYDDVLAADTEFTPGELGKGIPDALIEITYTSASPNGWGVVGFAAKDTSWNWLNGVNNLASNGEGVTTTRTFTYEEFVDCVGVGDDVNSFVVQNWGLEAESNFKVSLLLPTTKCEESVTVDLYKGDFSDNPVFTPKQLGSTIPGAVITINYFGEGEEGEAAVGISGNGAEWYNGENCLASVGAYEPNSYSATYEELLTFVNFPGPVDTIHFQNWGVPVDEVCTITITYPTGNVPCEHCASLS